MKYIRKYSYLIQVFLLLLMIVLIMNSKNKGLASSIAIAESSAGAMAENKSYWQGSDDSTEETLFTGSEAEEQIDSTTITESSEKAIDENRSYSSESEYPEEKKFHAIEGIPGYEYADRFPADMVFASPESIELLADIYEDIGFEGEFQFGDKTVYDFYRQKYSLVLDRKVKIYDRKGNESLLYNRYHPIGRLQYQLNIQEATDKIYFFDIDGDGLPELCVQGTSGTYVCKYDADSDQYTEWWGATNSGYTILGTRKIAGAFFILF